MNNTTEFTTTTLAPQEDEDESFTTDWDVHLENIIFFAVGIVIVATAIWQRRGIKGLFSGVANDPTNTEANYDNEMTNYETTNDHEMTNISTPQSPLEVDPTNNKLEDLQLESSKAAELTTLPTSLDTTTSSTFPPVDQESGLVNASQQQQQQNTFGSNNYYSNTTTAAGQRPQQQPQLSNQRKKTGGLFYRLIGRLPQSDQ